MTTAEMLSGIREAFEQKNAADQKMIRLEEKAESGDARLVEMNDYAARAGKHLSESLIETFRDSGVARITDDVADGTIIPALKEGHEKVVETAVSVQEGVDRKNGIGLKPAAPEFPADRARNLAGKAAEQAEEMEDGGEYHLEDSLKWLGEPVVNFVQAAYDSFVQKNAEFRSGAGLKTTITREASGNCCPWCAGLVGTYSYAETKGSDVYRRHQNCRCTVTYESGRTRQDVWSKRSWEASAKELERRRNMEFRDNEKPSLQRILESGFLYQFGIPNNSDVLTEAIIDNHEALKYYTPKSMKAFLESCGYDILPLSRSKSGFRDKSFEDGGGYKILYGGDGIFRYHPEGGRHLVSYWKVSSGKYGSHSYDMDGNEILF